MIESDFWKPDFTVLVDNRDLKQIKKPDKFTAGGIEFFAANKDVIGKACIAIISAKPENFKYSREFQYGIRLKGSEAVLQIFGSETQATMWVEHYCKVRDTKGGTVAA
jgi:hypothetical protein